jgi:hypothetical protein
VELGSVGRRNCERRQIEIGRRARVHDNEAGKPRNASDPDPHEFTLVGIERGHLWKLNQQGRPVRQKTTPLDRSVTRRCLGPGFDSGRKVLGEPLRRESRHFLESSWFLEQVSGSRNDD